MQKNVLLSQVCLACHVECSSDLKLDDACRYRLAIQEMYSFSLISYICDSIYNLIENHSESIMKDVLIPEFSIVPCGFNSYSYVIVLYGKVFIIIYWYTTCTEWFQYLYTSILNKTTMHKHPSNNLVFIYQTL